MSEFSNESIVINLDIPNKNICEIKKYFVGLRKIAITRWVALMIQLEQQQHGGFVGGVVGWLTSTTYIQLAGAGSKIKIVV